MWIYYIFLIYKWLYYNNLTCVKDICSIGQVFWCLYNTTKIPFIFISMGIFSHFGDVFIQYYKIVILHFYYQMFNIALGGILYQKLPKKLWMTIFLKHSSKPTPCQGHQMCFSMVAKTWSNVSYCWIFNPTYFWHYWISNWNRKDFFFG
jgi:hypothetical protein